MNKPPPPSQAMRRLNSQVASGTTDWLRNLNKDVRKSNWKLTEEAKKRDKARRAVDDIRVFEQFREDLKEVWE